MNNECFLGECGRVSRWDCSDTSETRSFAKIFTDNTQNSRSIFRIKHFFASFAPNTTSMNATLLAELNSQQQSMTVLIITSCQIIFVYKTCIKKTPSAKEKNTIGKKL